MNNTSSRVVSIDVFRAITMFLMIFVNDLWSISGVPHWMEHSMRGEDYLCFADIIFPAFLFITGMSIPFAIENRIKKGESKLTIIKHIALRSIALLIMGLFTVNYLSLDKSIVSKNVYTILMLIGFFLTWNSYPKTQDWRRYLYIGLQILGIALLVFLAFIFRDGSGNIMQPKWWGILGLVGWTYLICSLIYLFIRQKIKFHALIWLFFVFICIAEANNWLGDFKGGILPGRGTFHAFAMGGLITSLLFNRFPFKKSFPLMITLGIIILILGWICNNFWIVSKLTETPPWLFYCLGISLLSYILTYWIVEINEKHSWFRWIEPAGTASLTCYLIPHGIYSITHFALPATWLVYPYGLLRCILLAFLSIWITWDLGKIGIKLKI